MKNPNGYRYSGRDIRKALNTSGFRQTAPMSNPDGSAMSPKSPEIGTTGGFPEFDYADMLAPEARKRYLERRGM